MSAGQLGVKPWGAQLGRPGGDDGSDGPEPGTVVTQAPITGDGQVATPVGISPATDLAAGSMSAADKTKLDGLPSTITVSTQAPITGDGSGGSPIGITNATESAAGAMSVSDKIYLDRLEAQWDPTLCRYYLVDYDGGSDANTGFVDAAAGATIVPTGLALKTTERLFNILPRIGNGRTLKILIKNRAAGANYLQQDGVTLSNFSTAGLTGYALIVVSGSSDLTNSTADQVSAGAVQGAAGPGGGGVWTSGAGATTTSLTVSAGTIPAEPGVIGMRVRFTGNITGALANAVANISASTGTTLTFGAALGTSPASGDTFTIEVPGVRFNHIRLESAIPEAVAAGITMPGLTGVGLAATAAVDAAFFVCAPAGAQVSFCEATDTDIAKSQLVVVNTSFAQVSRVYSNEAGASVITSIGARSRGRFLFQDCATINVDAFAAVGAGGSTRTVFLRCQLGSFGTFGSYLGSPSRFTNMGAIGATTNPAMNIGGGRLATANAKLRSVGSMSFINFVGAIGGCDIVSAGAAGALSFLSAGTAYYTTIDAVSGSTGNTLCGIDLRGCQTCNIALGTAVANTVTGTSGDVEMIGGVFVPHATFTTVSITESGNNTVSGSGGILVKDRCFSFTNGDATAHAIGDVVRLTSSTTCVKAQADTAANATGALFVSLTTAAAGALGFYVPAAVAAKRMNFGGAGTLNGIAYLSTATAGQVTATPPALALTNQKRRLGVCYNVGAPASVSGSVDNLPVLADGLP